MVRTPSSVNVQVRSSPQVPLSAARAVTGIMDTIRQSTSTKLRNRLIGFIFFPSFLNKIIYKRAASKRLPGDSCIMSLRKKLFLLYQKWIYFQVPPYQTCVSAHVRHGFKAHHPRAATQMHPGFIFTLNTTLIYRCSYNSYPLYYKNQLDLSPPVNYNRFS